MKSPVHPDIEMKQIVKHGIVIDYCPRSGGVWLDKGELEKLIELSSRDSYYEEEDNVPFAQTPRVQYGHSGTHPHSSHHSQTLPPHKKKKENILGEIFDFDFF